VFVIFGRLGTPRNIAVAKYLNTRQVRDLLASTRFRVDHVNFFEANPGPSYRQLAEHGYTAPDWPAPRGFVLITHSRHISLGLQFDIRKIPQSYRRSDDPIACRRLGPGNPRGPLRLVALLQKYAEYPWPDYANRTTKIAKQSMWE
jgi:hypothetical protein